MTLEISTARVLVVAHGMVSGELVSTLFLNWNLVFIGKVGEIFVRYDCDHMFWRCDINGKGFKCIYDCESLCTRIGEEWLVAVYVKKIEPEFNNIRRDLLELQDGQSRICCRTHQFPLVTSALRPRTCAKEGCKRQCFLQCPQIGCKHGLCRTDVKSCLDTIEGDAHIEIPEQVVNHEGISQDDDTEIVNDEEDGSDCVRSSYGAENDNESFQFESDNEDVDWSINVTSGSENSFDLDSISTDSDEIDDELWQWVPEDPDDLGIGPDGSAFETRKDEDEAQEDVTSKGYFIPTTNAGRCRYQFDTRKLTEEGKMIPNHVLLNNSGSIVVMTGCKATC
jgi:hypothetical protein